MGRKRKLRCDMKKVKMTYEKLWCNLEMIAPIDLGQVYNFWQYYEKPERDPIVNILQAEMYRRNLSPKDYDEIDQSYGISKKRIWDTLTAKDKDRREPVLIECLAKYFNINPSDTENLDYHIANYDFEEKRKNFKEGKKSVEEIEEFLSEFDKSFSEENIQKRKAEYQKKREDDGFWDIEDDELLDRIADKEKRKYVKRFMEIYEWNSSYAKDFCDYFIFEDEK